MEHSAIPKSGPQPPNLEEIEMSESIGDTTYLWPGDKFVSVHHERKEITIQIGSDNVVTIDKLYGPLACWDVRVRIEYPFYWVIEQFIDTCDDCSKPGDECSVWVERARFPVWPPEVKEKDN